MSYARPVVLTDGDIVSTVYFKRERLRWIQYQLHSHAPDSGPGEGGGIGRLNPTAYQVMDRHDSDAA